MKIGLMVGTRPEIIKASALWHSKPADVDLHLIHSGQHTHDVMAKSLFSELGLPTPTVALDARAGGLYPKLGVMIDSMLLYFEQNRYDAVFTIGDTNTVMACSIAANRLAIPHARIEAGPRTHDRTEPEESNRIASDHLGDILLAPTQFALQNLVSEGLADRSYFVGDITLDALLLHQAKNVISHDTDSQRQYGLLTIHRPSNVDKTDRLRNLLNALGSLSVQMLFVVHPRIELPDGLPDNLIAIPPCSYCKPPVFTALPGR